MDATQSLIERKLSDGRTLTISLHSEPGYLVAKADGKTVVAKGVLGWLSKPSVIGGKTFTHSMGSSMTASVGIALTQDEHALLNDAVSQARRHAAQNRVMTSFERGWQFEIDSDRDADR